MKVLINQRVDSRLRGNDEKEAGMTKMVRDDSQYLVIQKSRIFKPFVMSLSNHNGALRQAQSLPRTWYGGERNNKIVVIAVPKY